MPATRTLYILLINVKIARRKMIAASNNMCTLGDPVSPHKYYKLSFGGWFSQSPAGINRNALLPFFLFGDITFANWRGWDRRNLLDLMLLHMNDNNNSSAYFPLQILRERERETEEPRDWSGRVSKRWFLSPPCARRWIDSPRLLSFSFCIICKSVVSLVWVQVN